MGMFTEAFANMDEAARESFYKTVFLNDPSDYGAKIRQEYYRSVLGYMGKDVKIGTGVKIVNPHLVRLEDGVIVEDDCTLIAREGTYIHLGKNVILSERVYLDTQCEGGYMEIGEWVYLGTGTTCFGHRGLEIGDCSLIAQNVTITPYSHIFDDPGKRIWDQGGHMKKVTIGKDCYLGMGVCVMYSGDIGDGSVIGAGSTVVKPIPPYSVAVGTPARVIKERK